MNKFTNTLKGIAMGIAEVIPGVSGGTIAFITGIYPKLIFTIKSFDLKLFRNIKKQGIIGLSESIDLIFLGTLLSGMVVGLLTGIFGVTYFYDNYPEPLWGFFFGLIVASSVYIAKMIGKWEWSTLVIGLVGIIIAYLITVISPADGSGSYMYIFISGVLAISALILPGISGSFILLLLGMYTVIIPSVKSLITQQDWNSFITVTVFASGCLVGLAGFSRVLHFLFNKYEKKTLALLTGFMVGSLNKIWPWRNPALLLEKETGKELVINSVGDLNIIDVDGYKTLTEVNVMPHDYYLSSPYTEATIISFFCGLILVFIFYIMDKRKPSGD